MKKGLIIIVLVGMLGWAVYDFAGKSNDTADPEEETVDADQKQAFDVADEEDSDAVEANETSEDEDEEESSDEETMVGLEKGNAAPDFDLETLDGEEVSLSDYQGERVMLNFWATWCPPCRAEMPDLVKFANNNDVTVLGVNLTQTEDNVDKVEDFVDEYDADFPILLDEHIEVAGLYGIQPIPTTYMIDSDGIIRNKAFGALQYDRMVSELDKMN